MRTWFQFGCVAALALTLSPLTAGGASRVDTLVKDLQAKDPKTRLAAAQSLGEMGSAARKAVPALVSAASAKNADLALRHEAIQSLGRIGSATAVPALTTALDDSAGIIRYSAIQSLGMIGPESKGAVPQLEKLLKADEPYLQMAAAGALARIASNPAVIEREVVPALMGVLLKGAAAEKVEASVALSHIGPAALSAVTKALGTAEPEVAVHLCDVAGQMGPAAAAATPELFKLLASKSADVAAHAAQAVGAIGANPDAAVPALTRLLKSETAAVRVHAVLALGQFGEDAKSSVPAVTALLADPDETVQRASAKALGTIGPSAAAAIPQLIKALHAKSGAVTVHAADALARIGPAAVPALISVLGEEDLRGLAAMILGDLGSAAKPAVPALLEAARDSRLEVRREAYLALAAIGPDAIEAKSELLKTLAEKGNPGQVGAAYALVKMSAREAIPELRKHAGGPVPEGQPERMLQAVSAWGLLQFNPDDKEIVALAMPKIIAMLQSPVTVARREGANALAMLGSRAAEAIPALLKALPDEEAEVRADVLHALGEIGLKDAKAVAAVIPLLHDESPEVRVAASVALGRAGAAAAGAVPLLQQAVEDGSPMEQTVAVWALLKIAPTPELKKRAVPLLTAALSHPNPLARREAALTLGNLGADAKSAVAALKEAATDDPDQTAREAAAAALARVNATK